MSMSIGVSGKSYSYSISDCIRFNTNPTHAWTIDDVPREDEKA